MGGLLVAAALLGLATTARCEADIAIFDNTDGVPTPVPAAIEVIDGRNFSLLCKTSGSGVKVAWGRKGRGLKTPFSSYLNFTPTRVEDLGTYFCVSLKYKTYKHINIVMKPSNTLNVDIVKDRWKRADGADSSNESSKSFTFSVSNTSISPIGSTSEYDSIYWNHETFTLPSDVIYFFKKNSYEYDNQDYTGQSFTAKGVFSYIGVIAAVIAFILIVGGLLYRLMKRFDLLHATSPEQAPAAEPACQHRSCGQYCTLAADNRQETNPYCVVSIIEASYLDSARLPPAAGAISNTEGRGVDPPPSYDSTVNSRGKYDLPPSYSEALTSARLPYSKAINVQTTTFVEK